MGCVHGSILSRSFLSHLRLQRSGSAHKACCPFHDEKTPSFTIQRGDTHYHCYGCGAHGDAIAFLMGYLKMSFVEAIEHLAERFQVVLEKSDEAQEGKGPNKPALKNMLERACQLYHFMLYIRPLAIMHCVIYTREASTSTLCRNFASALRRRMPNSFKRF